MFISKTTPQGKPGKRKNLGFIRLISYGLDVNNEKDIKDAKYRVYNGIEEHSITLSWEEIKLIGEFYNKHKPQDAPL